MLREKQRKFENTVFIYHSTDSLTLPRRIKGILSNR